MDQVRPYDAGNRTQGQEAAAAVFAVMSHAAERDEAQQQKKAPKKKKHANSMLPVAIKSPNQWVGSDATIKLRGMS